MAYEAAKVALANRGIEPTELDAIIVCTVTPDMFFPATACLVQNKLGAKSAWGFDLVNIRLRPLPSPNVPRPFGATK